MHGWHACFIWNIILVSLRDEYCFGIGTVVPNCVTLRHNRRAHSRTRVLGNGKATLAASLVTEMQV